MKASMLTICLASTLIKAEALTSNFEVVTSSNGVKLCAVAKPLRVASKVRSAVKCGAICATDDYCETYNFRDDLQQCDFFAYTSPQDFSAIPGCRSYRLQGLRPLRSDCSEIQRTGGYASGVYNLNVSGYVIHVYCDMGTDGGGWLVIQRRMDGSVDFYRPWVDYANGFGSPAGEFWIGNDNINLLTSAKRYRLRIDMSKMDDTTSYAEYDNFRVNSAADNYRLASLGIFSGPAGNGFVTIKPYCERGDSLTGHQLGRQFSTYDKNNQIELIINCTGVFRGAWWHQGSQGWCMESNLNGYYYGGPHTSFADGVEWPSWTGYYYSLKMTEMKIRPV